MMLPSGPYADKESAREAMSGGAKAGRRHAGVIDDCYARAMPGTNAAAVGLSVIGSENAMPEAARGQGVLRNNG